jgi:hypothetical protein
VASTKEPAVSKQRVLLSPLSNSEMIFKKGAVADLVKAKGQRVADTPGRLKL